MTGTRQAWATTTGAPSLPSHWAIIRAQVLLRDRHTCQACAGTRCGNLRLEVDHIVNGDNHDLTNLQTLGRTCHRANTTQEMTA